MLKYFLTLLLVSPCVMGAPPSLVPPAGLSGTATDNTVLLRWRDTNKKERGYTISRDGRVVGSTPKDATSYTDSGLAAETAYIYRVKADGSREDSAYSAPLTVITKPVIAPPDPIPPPVPPPEPSEPPLSADCSIATAAETENRKIPLTLDCPGAKFYRLFEGAPRDVVTVSVDDTTPDYAIVSIRYKDGEPGELQPYAIRAERSFPRYLIVPFTFRDQDNVSVEFPDYWTDAWLTGYMQRIAGHIRSSTLGTVDPVMTYHDLVVLDLERHRSQYDSQLIADDILRQVDHAAHDYVWALSPNLYQVWRDLEQIQTKIMASGFGTGAGTRFNAPITERRTSLNANIILPQFNPSANDPIQVRYNGAGYGGKQVPCPHNTNPYYIRLYCIETDRPLPGEQVDVDLTYTALTAGVGSSYQYNRALHELYHFSDAAMGIDRDIGDVYLNPTLWGQWDIMDEGVGTFSPLGAYVRESIGVARPATLEYGKNATVRIKKTPFDGTPGSRMVRVPLHHSGDFVVADRFYHSPDGSRLTRHEGPEYLLLEYRTDGVLIAHTVRSSVAPQKATSGYYDVSELRDSTPKDVWPTGGDGLLVRDVSRDFVAWRSGQSYTHTTGAWQSKQTDVFATEYLLSGTVGAKSLYAYFRYQDGRVVRTSPITVSLKADNDRTPSVAINLVDNESVYVKTINPEIFAPNGLKYVSYKIDGKVYRDYDLWSFSDGLYSYDEARAGTISLSKFLLEPGQHTLSVDIVDAANNRASDEKRFSIQQ